MKNLTGVLISLVVVATAFVPTAANAETFSASNTTGTTSSTEFDRVSGSAATAVDQVVLRTGNYEYNCIGADGSSYFLAEGAPLTDCKGNFIQKYLDGNMLQSVALAYGGGAVSTAPAASDGCIVAVASGVALAFFPPTGVLAWVTSGGLAAAGIATSCTSL